MNNQKTRECYNKARVSGILTEEFRYSHTVLSEHFYEAILKCKRLSGIEDFIPIIISEVLLDNLSESISKNQYVEITGEYRTHNYGDNDGRRRLKQYLFVSDIKTCNKEDIGAPGDADINEIYLKGYICKEPVLRATPSGLNITDLILAVNKGYWKSNYIPCIAWNKMALFTSKLNVGDKVSFRGRIQSRDYLKIIETGDTICKRVNEISIISIEKMKEL